VRWRPAPTSDSPPGSNPPPTELHAQRARIAFGRGVTVNAELSAEDRFYEWLLSDHPGAALERARRRLDNQVREAQERAVLRRFIARTNHSPTHQRPCKRWPGPPDGWWNDPNSGRPPRRLAPTPSWSPPPAATLRPASSQQAGRDPDYRYPARYLHEQAARQPIPPDPGARLHDPEERPALGDRTVTELEAENSPYQFVRTQAITGRAQAARQRAQQPQPARLVRDDTPRGRPYRVRGARQEAERER
jgi:hypothetical protein